MPHRRSAPAGHSTPYHPFATRVRLRRRQRRVARLLRGLALCCLAAALVMVLRQQFFRGGQPTLAPLHDGPLPTAGTPDTAQTAAAFETPEAAPGSAILERYRRLYQRNPDLVGWLQVPGTGIDYPVLQTPGRNEYYLRRGFDGFYSLGGSLFMDEHCTADGQDTNLLIYGHNMMDGSMFGQLYAYADPEFYAEHPTLRYDTLWQEGVWQVVAAVQTDTVTEYPYYHFFSAGDQDTWNRFCAGIADHALYDTGVTVAYGDQLLILSTCATWLDSTHRFGVIAKRLE